MKELLIFIHIAAGFSALLGALVAAASKMPRGAHRWHIRGGRVFFGGMLAAFFTAVPLALLDADVFLLLVAVFSGYLAWSGWAYAKNRRGAPRLSDWARTGGMLAASLAMAGYGAHLAPTDADGITLLVLAGIGAALGIGDIQTLRAGGVTGAARIISHLTRMLGGLIASVTAVVVVNFDFEPAIVLWLAPTAVITPVIVVWRRKIRAGLRPPGMTAADT